MENNGNKNEGMKTKKRLLLRKETLRKISDSALAQVYGGNAAQMDADDMGDAKKSKRNML